MIIGITGLIGTGKSTLAKILERNHSAMVHDADHCVHELYESKAVLKSIANALAVDPDDVTHAIIMDHIKNNPYKKSQVEAIIHPLVRQSQIEFLKQYKDKPLRVLDIPLLYETKAEQLCDKIWVTHCDRETIKKRVLSRPHFDENKLNTILSWQSDHRGRADHVFDTDKSLKTLEAEVQTLLGSLL